MIDRKFMSDVWVGYLTNGASLACGFFLMLVITRLGGLAVFGAFVVMGSFANVCGNLMSFRTNEALVAFYKRAEVSGDWGMCKFAIIGGIALDLIAGGLLLLLIRFYSPSISEWFLKSGDLGGAVELYGLVAFATTVRSTPYGFLQATGRLKLLNIIRLSEHLSRLITLLGLSLYHPGIDLEAVAVAVAISAFITVGFAYLPLVMALCSTLKSITITWKKPVAARYLRFCLTTFASSALKAGNQNIDTLAVGIFTDTKTAGIYGMIRQFLSPVAFLSAPFASISYPQFVKAHMLGQLEVIRQNIRAIDRKIVLAGAVFLVVILPVFIIYTRQENLDMSASIYVAITFLAARALLQTRLWWVRPFSNATRPGLSVMSNAFATLFMVLILLPMTLSFGLTGAAASMCALAVLLTIFWAKMSARVA